MPRGRKRKDPEATYPIDGRYQGKDTILNKVDGRRYALLDESSPSGDVAGFKVRGFKRSERSPDRKDVPMYDTASPDDTGYRVGNLVMYEADESPDGLLVRAEEINVKRADQRMKAIGNKARGTGGQFKVQVQHQPMVR